MAILSYPTKGLRMVRNQREWSLALRFALFIIPAGIGIALVAVWLGYRASAAVLNDSLAALPLLEAKTQAARMEETLKQLRRSLIRIAQSGQPNAQELRENLQFHFQDNTDLVQEIGFKDSSGNGFMLLRDKGAFNAASLADASQGPYSPFQQISSLPLHPGAATLYPPVYFDDPGSGIQDPALRVPVMRMALPFADNSGVLVLGIGLAQWRNKLAAPMQPGSPLRTATQDGAMQLSFFFDTRGWILFEMDSSGGKTYFPDLARAGYNGDLGRAGYDAAFRPWAAHENYWRMVTEVDAGRSGSMLAPANKYTSAHVGATGFLCFAPVSFSPADNATPAIIGGIAFFETSTLPLAAFLRLGNFSLGMLVAAFVAFGFMAARLGKKLGTPLAHMADELSHIAESGDLGVVNTEPAFEEQQRIKAAINHIIADAIGTRHDLERLTREMQQTRSSLPVDLSPTLDASRSPAEFDLVGSSSLIREVREHVRKAARAGTDVLIWGETGTGKELVAAAIHKAGSRGTGPYVSINCGALDENLLLDALFGHVKGAFTEAKNDRKGAFLAAHEGTLHLDEIANASLKVQQALLRALSVRRIRPLGTDQEQTFDTRVVAATNVDLRECVRAGTFREDLYYRLAIISIETPPLRHRKEDIPELAAFCIRDAAVALGRPEARLSRGALDLMYAYDWPGNVREFKNCLTRAMAFVEGDLILPQHITLEQDAFRTYNKPLSPKVLAKRIHTASPAPPAQKQPWDPARSAPAALPGTAGADGAPANEHKPTSVAGGMGHAAEYLWPAPPRDTFTPAIEEGEKQPRAAAQEKTTAQATSGNSCLSSEDNGRGDLAKAALSALGDAPFPPDDAGPDAATASAVWSVMDGLLPEKRDDQVGRPLRGEPEEFSLPLGRSAADNAVPFAHASVQRAAARQAASQLAAARQAAERQRNGNGNGNGAHTAHSPHRAVPAAAMPRPPARNGTTAPLNERQMQALEFVRGHGEITRSLYEDVLGQDVSARTAQNDLRELVDRAILKRIGAGPGTRYVPGSAFP